MIGDWIRVKIRKPGKASHKHPAQDTPTHPSKEAKGKGKTKASPVEAASDESDEGVPAGRHVMGHIIPHSFKVSDLGYMFGSGEPFTHDPENAVPLMKVIEEQFDNQTITFVPVEIAKFEALPEYKLVVLKEIVFEMEPLRSIDKQGKPGFYTWEVCVGFCHIISLDLIAGLTILIIGPRRKNLKVEK